MHAPIFGAGSGVDNSSYRRLSISVEYREAQADARVWRLHVFLPGKQLVRCCPLTSNGSALPRQVITRVYVGKRVHR
jgi:hypothetical protein